ncbi:Plant invertase/pectin methylesterase inhibitor superfamily protein [Hirschfeldia incana]|nr:Plant invertase/pectin methylesterase inhibitor superfamily protein [Hirschfeldia incana]
MESINTLKGYDKVSDQENQIPSPLPKPPSRKTLIATVSVVSLLLILAAVVALTAGAFTRPSHNNPPVSSSNSLKAVCAVTRYPQTCFDALSSSSSSLDGKINPESILELSLQVTAKKVSNLSVSFRSINDMPEEAAVGDCVKLYADAVSQVNESVSEIEREKKKGGDWLTKNVVGDVKTWISAAMTDGETCSDGLEEMGTVVGNEIKKKMVTVSEMLSISLAIVSEMQKLRMVFH